MVMVHMALGTGLTMAAMATGFTKKGTALASGTATTTAVSTQTKIFTELLSEVGVCSRPSSFALRNFLKPSPFSRITQKKRWGRLVRIIGPQGHRQPVALEVFPANSLN